MSWRISDTKWFLFPMGFEHIIKLTDITTYIYKEGKSSLRYKRVLLLVMVFDLSNLPIVYCWLTFIHYNFILRFTGDKLVSNLILSRSLSLKQIYNIYGLVCGEKYSHPQGSRKPRIKVGLQLLNLFIIYSNILNQNYSLCIQIHSECTTVEPIYTLYNYLHLLMIFSRVRI